MYYQQGMLIWDINMKNKKEKIKDDILIFLFFWMVTFAIIVNRYLNNLDEVWVFNTARNIANGLLPYRDFNLVTTPGLPILCGIFLKIFGTEMVVMRILASILSATIMFYIYKILNILEIKKDYIIIILAMIFSLFVEHFCIDYNFAILLIALIILKIELSNYKKTNNLLQFNVKRELILGILAGISITMKQTTGICFSIVFIGYKILAVRKKEEFKQFLKISLTRFLGVAIPVMLLILYLIYNEIIGDFFDYTILGIKEFKNNIPYYNLLKGDLKLLAVIVPLGIIIAFYKSIKERNMILTILFAYSISTIIVVYPISDNIHFLIGGTIGIITLVYMLKLLINKYFDEVINNEKLLKFIEIVTIVIISFMLVVSLYKIIGYLGDCDNYKLQNFKYIPVYDDMEECIQKVDDYILKQGQEVYILAARACIYMIPINRYNKNYDMFLIGNIGSKGSGGIIEELKSKENIKLLLLNNERNLNWQTPLDVIKYVKENYNKTDEIEIFDVYEK